MAHDALPIDALRAPFIDALPRGPVVLTSPTGSGKSTQVPRWLAALPGAPKVLVVQPRRLACRALAARVAELDGTPLGDRVGYNVRDERKQSDRTQVLFVTPGVALRMFPEWTRWGAVVLDEFHERSLDTDLLLGLLAKHYDGRLVVMSATLAGERIATHLQGALLQGEARTFPVEFRYLGDHPAQLPHEDRLDHRVRRALDAARGDPGDVLVFLPGKGEIHECARALRGRDDVEVIALHGSLTLDAQRAAFQSSARRKVVLATNVAETSVTIPGIGVVIDVGMVRQTRYRGGRASLVLVPVAKDSADQRAGRAGRTAPGVCYRLWSQAARLSANTPPEVHRESLVPLVLAAAACGTRPEELPLLDAPRPGALVDARAELTSLGALDAKGEITPRGRELFGLPLDAALGRLLVEARGTGALDDVIDLVAALGTGRPMFSGRAPMGDDDHALRAGGCDATALIRAVRWGDPESDGLSRTALDEARRTRERLRRAHGLDPRATDLPLDRDRLARTALAADPRCVHVPRKRGNDLAWSNGGTELELARESAVNAVVKEVDAIAVLDSRAVGDGRDAVIYVTCATPLKRAWLLEAGVGRDRLAGVTVERGRAVAKVERVYARKVLAEREEVPEGDVARDAIAELFLRGSIFRESLAVTKERLAAAALASRLLGSGRLPEGLMQPVDVEACDPAVWVRARLLSLGVTRGDELSLLSAADLVAEDIPGEIRVVLDKEFPRTVKVGDAVYEADYDLARRSVTLKMVHGSRKDPPPLQYLPRFSGLRICVEAGRAMWIVRP